jgi:CHAT domain-containing protein
VGITKLEALRQAQLELLRGEAQIHADGERDRGLVPIRESSGATGPEAPSFPVNANAPYAHPFYWAPFFLMGNWL